MVYLILVLVHVITVIIFLGNITITPFWKANAEKKKDRLMIFNAWEGIIKADRLFTMPGVVLLLIFGIGGALPDRVSASMVPGKSGVSGKLPYRGRHGDGR